MFHHIFLLLVFILGAYGQGKNVIVDGNARFWIITPTLIRLEYSPTATFENLLSFNVINRPTTFTNFTTSVSNGWREITTSNIDLKYQQNSGAFTAQNLQAVISIRQGETKTVYPHGALPTNNLGGWRRSLDLINESVPLYDGMLTQDGWYLIDDSVTALFGPNNWPIARNSTKGYQDGYFFAYGLDYLTGLQDFALVTGTAPLLPRFTFGVWFSEYYAYTAADYETNILPHFRSDNVPLDVLVIDTDWKSPNQWDGWNWNTNLFPNPDNFTQWTQSEGLKVTLNIHASIVTNDPKFPQDNQIAGGLINTSATNYCWDWGIPSHTNAFWWVLQPFEKQGIRFWWNDWCCDCPNIVSLPGLSGDGWLNHIYQEDLTSKGLRGFAFSRIGATLGANTLPEGPWGDHRAAVHFTGDTYGTWEMLDFESYFSIREANIGIAYVTHDIGSFHGGHLADDMYLRWVQLGTFQPIFRFHSDHADRLPWEYGTRVEAENFLRLRHAMVPYTYTLAYIASTTGIPLMRGLYLYYPDAPESYIFSREYFWGDQLIVRPPAAPGTSVEVPLWIPPGNWIHWFTGQIYTGPKNVTINATYNDMPLLAKTGAIVPMQPYMDYDGQLPVDPLIIRVFTGSDGWFTLYEDEGDYFNYQSGKFGQTAITYTDKTTTLNIAARQGTFNGAITQRAYNVTISPIKSLPKSVTVNNQPITQVQPGKEGFWYNSSLSTLYVLSTSFSISTAVSIAASF